MATYTVPDAVPPTHPANYALAGWVGISVVAHILLMLPNPEPASIIPTNQHLAKPLIISQYQPSHSTSNKTTPHVNNRPHAKNPSDNTRNDAPTNEESTNEVSTNYVIKNIESADERNKLKVPTSPPPRTVPTSLTGIVPVNRKTSSPATPSPESPSALTTTSAITSTITSATTPTMSDKPASPDILNPPPQTTKSNTAQADFKAPPITPPLDQQDALPPAEGAKQETTPKAKIVTASVANVTKHRTKHQAEHSQTDLVYDIRQQLEKHINYPLIAKKRGWEGQVTVGFYVNKQGYLNNIRITTSSGYAMLDQSALAAFNHILHISFKQGITNGPTNEVNVPIIYRLLKG